MSRRAVILLVGCLLCKGTSRILGAQTVNVSVWSSKIDHSLESVLDFQSQSREVTDAYIHVYDDILAQQIAQINVAAPSVSSADSKSVEAPPSLDQEADTLIVHPLLSGAETLRSAPGSDIDFMLLTQLFVAVKPKAYRIVSGVTGSDDLESLAFHNADGTYVLFTVNHSKSSINLEVLWKDRLFTYIQAGSSIGIFAWDPKSPLVSLVPSDPRILARGEVSISVEAKCLNVTPLGFDLRCESQALICSIYPVRFICDPQQESVILGVTVYSTDKNEPDPMKPGFVTITAVPDAGEATSFRVPCCSAEQ